MRRSVTVTTIAVWLSGFAPHASAQEPPPEPPEPDPAYSVELSIDGHRLRDRCRDLFEAVRGRRVLLTAKTRAPEVRIMVSERTDGSWGIVRTITVPVEDRRAITELRVDWEGKRRIRADVDGGSSDPLTVRGVRPRWTRYADGGVRLHVPYHRQQHNLSCESAALRMAHNYHRPSGIDHDREVMRVLGVDRRRPNVPGGCDPNRRFCGNVNGLMMRDGYGVHHRPIKRAANHFAPCRRSRALSGYNASDITGALREGFPVVVWGAHRGRSGIYRVGWRAHTGAWITAYSVEHTWTVVGFRGNPERPKSYLIHDPSRTSAGGARKIISRKSFNRFTQYYRTAVVVRG